MAFFTVDNSEENQLCEMENKLKGDGILIELCNKLANTLLGLQI